MVFIDGVKYACATCIKGHRSTGCQHSDRTLFVIKKKGRPITQCSHCRELRKTQKVHVKCNCNEKKKEESTLSQPVAVLPQGSSTDISTDQSLVEYEYDDYQPVSGDKTSVEALLNPCQCMTGAECICCRPIINHKHYIDEDFATPDTLNESSINTVQRSKFTLPPISQSFTPSLESYGGEYTSHSGYSNSSVQRNNSYVGSSFTSSLNLQERTYNPLEQRYSSPYDDKGNTDSKYHDQSEVLGEEIFRSTSTDLANIIYSPFRGCPSAIAKGSCCGGNESSVISVCRCGPSCKCTGCDAHAERVNPGSSITFQNQSSSSCCSSLHEVAQPEHTVIRDEDGVLLCGCGCQKLNTECSDCLENLCEEYLLK